MNATIEPSKTCRWCKQSLPLDRFFRWGRSADGFAYQCKPCRAAYEDRRRRLAGISARLRPLVRDGEKTCLACRITKPFDQFSPSKRGRNGFAAYCKPCIADRYRDKAKARESTAAYRARHPERWKAMNRLNQFKRRTKAAANSDGTVTDAVLAVIYAETHCSYCLHPVPRPERTADHVIPLARGGMHSASNLVMACFSCNSSKAAMTGEEFRGSPLCPTK